MPKSVYCLKKCISSIRILSTILEGEFPPVELDHIDAAEDLVEDIDAQVLLQRTIYIGELQIMLMKGMMVMKSCALRSLQSD